MCYTMCAICAIQTWFTIQRTLYCFVHLCFSSNTKHVLKTQYTPSASYKKKYLEKSKLFLGYQI